MELAYELEQASMENGHKDTLIFPDFFEKSALILKIYMSEILVFPFIKYLVLTYED